MFVAIGIVILGSMKVEATSVPDRRWVESDFYIQYNSVKLANNSGIDLETGRDLIMVSTIYGFESGFRVSWTSTNKSVIDIEYRTAVDADGNPIPNNGTQIDMVRKGPGYSSLIATITTDTGTTFTLTCHVSVELRMDKEKPVFTTATTTNERILLFEELVAEGENVSSKQIPLMYIRGEKIEDNTTMEWTTSNPNVAEVDEEGNVTPKGAGYAVIKATTKTSSTSGKRMEDSVTVIVSPYGREQPAAQEATYNKNITYVAPSEDFYIETNAKDATKLIWDVRDKNNNRINPTGNPLLNYEIDNLSGRIYIYNAKAGAYTITAITNEKYGKETWNTFSAKIIVPVIVNEGPIYMNVNDRYSLLESGNSNIPNLNVFSYKSKDSVIADIESATGIIQAFHTGKTSIELTYIENSLYTEDERRAIKDYYNSVKGADDPLMTNYNPSTEISIIVIDGISLSPNAAVIYVGGNIVLSPTSSSPHLGYKWTSSRPDVATVTDGTVNGLKVGETIITVSQVINGLTKSASCKVTVRETITGITIEPKEAIINVKETLTLSAKVTPSSMGINQRRHRKNYKTRWAKCNNRRCGRWKGSNPCSQPSKYSNWNM